MHTILIVDDHAAIRLAVRELFESGLESVICGEAENGAEAIRKAGELQPDLIILDLTMPVMDGFQAANTLRQLFPAIPIVMFTAHCMETTKQAAKQAGIPRGFLQTQGLEFAAGARTHGVGDAINFARGICF